MAIAHAQQWLEIQCRSIPSIERAIFVFADQKSKRLTMAACWPPKNKSTTELLATVRLAARKQTESGEVRATLTATKGKDYFAWPIYINGQLLGIVAVQTLHQDKPTQRAILETLKVGAQWLALPQPESVEQEKLFSNIVRLILSVSDKQDYRTMVTALVNNLTIELECERVSFGSVKKNRSEVSAISNSASIDEKSNLIRGVANVMDEAIDQDSIVNFPPKSEDGKIRRAHGELARRFGSGSILTIPILYADQIFAALTLERRESRPFTTSEVDMCQQLLAALASSLHMSNDISRPLYQRMLSNLRDATGALIGFSHLKTKLAAVIISAFLFFSATTTTQFRINADAALEGRIQRSIAAPVAGYIETSVARAGDTVQQGDIIATMDDRELQLELKRLDAQRQQANRELREAMANRDLVQVRVINAKLDQVTAEHQLAEDRIERTRIRAPFNAIIIEGDLTESLGAPVERGESLFRIAPLSGYRVILNVREQDISYIQLQQSGTLILASMPEEPLALTVENITAVATTANGKNVFRVEASLPLAPEIVRPGMAGVAKINTGEQRLLWIWSRDVIDWLKLILWRWLP